ncbi:MAG: response regulator [Chloroflexi bacterium]|nr:response regulator [Chloroflexota bacterium]
MAEQSQPIDFTSILVVDDNLPLLRNLAFLLKVAGFRVTTACSGERALEQLRRHTPDLIIADADMPGVSGFDLLGRVRADQRLHALPVILTSSRYTLDDFMLALDLGANQYMPKPFDIYDLLDTIKEMLLPQPLEVDFRQAG